MTRATEAVVLLTLQPPPTSPTHMPWGEGQPPHPYRMGKDHPLEQGRITPSPVPTTSRTVDACARGRDTCDLGICNVGAGEEHASSTVSSALWTNAKRAWGESNTCHRVRYMAAPGPHGAIGTNMTQLVRGGSIDNPARPPLNAGPSACT
jgi:hypothetical protein